VPVISVGNINVGGTGKTPLVETIAKSLIAKGYNTCVISRGYHRESKGLVVVSRGNGPEVSVAESGDEPFMLASLIPELQVIVNIDRVEAGRYAIAEMGTQVILLDDGFQHRSIARDLDVVIVPAPEILQKEPVLPAGLLREPWRGLERATHLIVTNIPENGQTAVINSTLRRWTDAKIHYAEKTSLAELHAPIKNETLSIADRSIPPKIFAVAGIGKPDQFRQGLKNAGVEIVDFKTYPDHFAYPLEKQTQLIGQFEKSGAEYLVITAKDYVKWSRSFLEEYPIYYLPVTYQFDSDFLDKIIVAIKILIAD